MREYGNVHGRQRAIRSHGIDFCRGFARSHDFGEPSGFAESLGFGEPHADGHQDGTAGETTAEEDDAGRTRAAETFDRTCCLSDTGPAGGLLSEEQRGDMLRAWRVLPRR
jgi:hypothetical protein